MKLKLTESSILELRWKCNILLIFFASIDDESGEKSVSVLLNGEESELIFIDHSTIEMSVSI